jgi:formate dehydrogenase major subunit
MDGNGVPKMDRTLSHKRSVFQLLRTHYKRYDLDTVSKVTGRKMARVLKNASGKRVEK